MKHKALIFAALWPLVALSGCNGVPISTQWKLRKFDLGTADVSRLRVALRTPEWATPTPDKTVVVASLLPGGASGEERKIELRLQRAEHARDLQELAAISRKAGPLAFFEVTARDLPTARALQQEAQRRKVEGHSAGGTISVDRGVACRKGALPDGPIPVDLFIHADDETGWLPLLEDYDVRDAVKTAEDMRKLEEGVPLCGKHAMRVGSAP